MNKTFVMAFISGLIFALGLGLSGMTQPQKVIGFLDLFGHWDPSLIFVMAGAIAVNGLYFWLLKPKFSQPLFAPRYFLPELKTLTPRLILGAAIFGIGWGLAGYCPGPALTSLASGQLAPLVFVAAMGVGMWVFRWWDRRRH